jgi:hypothetical protein
MVAPNFAFIDDWPKVNGIPLFKLGFDPVGLQRLVKLAADGLRAYGHQVGRDVDGEEIGELPTASFATGEAEVRSKVMYIESGELMGWELGRMRDWLDKAPSACGIEQLWMSASFDLWPFWALLHWALVLLPKIDSSTLYRATACGAGFCQGLQAAVAKSERPTWVQRGVTGCSRQVRGAKERAKLWKGYLLECRVPPADSFGPAVDVPSCWPATSEGARAAAGLHDDHRGVC